MPRYFPKATFSFFIARYNIRAYGCRWWSLAWRNSGLFEFLTEHLVTAGSIRINQSVYTWYYRYKKMWSLRLFALFLAKWNPLGLHQGVVLRTHNTLRNDILRETKRCSANETFVFLSRHSSVHVEMHTKSEVWCFFSSVLEIGSLGVEAFIPY